MGWNEKFDALERAALLYGDHVITTDEFKTIKYQILQLTVDDEQVIEQKQVHITNAYTSDVGSNSIDPHFLKTPEWVDKTGTGSTQPSNLGSVGIVEKDSLLDGEIVNTPVKKFKDDFERINVGDSPAADYY